MGKIGNVLEMVEKSNERIEKYYLDYIDNLSSTNLFLKEELISLTKQRNALVLIVANLTLKEKKCEKE